MSIWFSDYTVQDIVTKDTMVEHLGIEVTELGKDYVAVSYTHLTLPTIYSV